MSTKGCEHLLGRDNFEEDGEDRKRGFPLVHDHARFGDADTKDSKEHVPQVEA